MNAIVLTLLGHFDPDRGWATPVEGGRAWLVARPFDAVAPIPGTGAPLEVRTLLSLAGDPPGQLWGVRESVDDVANLMDARRAE